MAENTLHFESPRAMSDLYGGHEKNLSLAETALGVDLVSREDWVRITAETDEAVERAELLFGILEAASKQGLNVVDNDFEAILEAVADDRGQELLNLYKHPLVIKLKNKSIIPKTLNQKRYLKAIHNKDVVFGIGPAGTGKTFLAVAAALDYLQKGEIERIVLTRPAVEAGEALGFLPGDLTEKIQPYLTPLYDSMFQMVGKETGQKLIDRGTIEIAPLAYMRGRTLSNAFIILDEAQNTTREQMMMFLTRLGENGRMVITGDITQVDLPSKKTSGLAEARQALKHIKDIEFHEFSSVDVVRHRLVAKIINAYERYHKEQGR